MTALVVIFSITSGIFVSFNWYFWYIILKEIIQLFPVNFIEAYAPFNTLPTTNNPLTTNAAVLAFWTSVGWTTKFPSTYQTLAAASHCAGSPTATATDNTSFNMDANRPPCYWPKMKART